MPSRLLFACDGPTAARRALRFTRGQAAAARAPLFRPAARAACRPPPARSRPAGSTGCA